MEKKFKNRIVAWLFGGPPNHVPAHPEIPNLTKSTLSVYHDGLDITVHWIDSVFINRVSFNAIFGCVAVWNSTTRTDIV